MSLMQLRAILCMLGTDLWKGYGGQERNKKIMQGKDSEAKSMHNLNGLEKSYES